MPSHWAPALVTRTIVRRRLGGLLGGLGEKLESGRHFEGIEDAGRGQTPNIVTKTEQLPAAVSCTHLPVASVGSTTPRTILTP